MAGSDPYRDYCLSLACRRADPQVIEGVRFDLRHDDLPRDFWEPIHTLDWPVWADPYAPRLLFPWSDGHTRAVFEQRGGGIEVKLGDTVCIEAVLTMPVKAERGLLDHPQHQERRWARLMVVRPNGSSVVVEPGWAFRGVQDVLTPARSSDWSRARWALVARFAALLGVEDPDDYLLKKRKGDWEALLAEADPALAPAGKALWAADVDYDENAGFAFGYLMGRAEASALLLPSAERAQKMRQDALAAAQSPRRAGELTRGAAAALLLRNPDMSLKRCAEVVADERGLRDARSVRKTIESLFLRDSEGRWRADLNAVRAAAAKVGG